MRTSNPRWIQHAASLNPHRIFTDGSTESFVCSQNAVCLDILPALKGGAFSLDSS